MNHSQVTVLAVVDSGRCAVEIHDKSGRLVAITTLEPYDYIDTNGNQVAGVLGIDYDKLPMGLSVYQLWEVLTAAQNEHLELYA